MKILSVTMEDYSKDGIIVWFENRDESIKKLHITTDELIDILHYSIPMGNNKFSTMGLLSDLIANNEENNLFKEA